MSEGRMVTLAPDHDSSSLPLLKCESLFNSTSSYDRGHISSEDGLENTAQPGLTVHRPRAASQVPVFGQLASHIDNENSTHSQAYTLSQHRKHSDQALANPLVRDASDEPFPYHSSLSFFTFTRLFHQSIFGSDYEQISLPSFTGNTRAHRTSSEHQT